MARSHTEKTLNALRSRPAPSILPRVTIHATLTQNARRDCERYGIDVNELDDLLNAPIRTQVGRDAYDYCLGRLRDGRYLQLTRLRGDTLPVLLHRVIVVQGA